MGECKAWCGTIGVVATIALAAGATFAGEVRVLQWEDLVAVADGRGLEAGSVPRGIVQHDDIDGLYTGTPLAGLLGRADAASTAALRHDLHGSRVELAGYLLPLAFEGFAVTEFLLVPFVGACIHVPPPPANQIVLVDHAPGIEVRGLFEPVRVAGRLTAEPVSVDLAEVGYRIDAERVEVVVRPRR